MSIAISSHLYLANPLGKLEMVFTCYGSAAEGAREQCSPKSPVACKHSHSFAPALPHKTSGASGDQQHMLPTDRASPPAGSWKQVMTMACLQSE